MSVPNVIHPWTAPQPTLTALPPTPVVADAQPIANALFAAGFVASAIAVAGAGSDPELAAMVERWRTTQGLDASLAGMIDGAAGAVVPSVTAREDGSPRFVLRIPDGAAAVAAISAEHGGDGVDAELRLFLDDALRNGDRFVDAAPGLGFGAMSAASGAATVSVIVLCADAAQRDAMETSAHLSDVSDCVTVREATSLMGVSFAPALPGAHTVLHAGSAADVAPLLMGAREALERREIGAVAWRCGRADETGRDAEHLQVAAAVLGVFGFQHFALASGDAGMELVPADAMATNAMIFSLEPSFMARFAA